MRILIQRATGFDMNLDSVTPPLYRFPQYGKHLFLDVTDDPCPTIMTSAGGSSQLKFVLLPEEGDMPEPLVRHFSGTPDWSAGDITDVPSPAVTVGVHSLNSTHWSVRDDGQQTDPETGADLRLTGELAKPRAFPRSRSVGADKPSYRVPSMAEIRAVPWNGYTAISTFSGCGGSSLGYRMAGFKVLWASEFVEAARDTYRANSDAILDGRDIRDVTPQEILDAIGMEPGQLDLMDGSPPCASFSTAGKRHEKWGKVSTYSDTEQRSDDLFFEYIRLVDGIRPRVFVAENVSGLLKGTAKGYFIEIMRAMRECGYRVAARLLDAQWLGVPQARQRVIFIGVRSDLGVPPAYPTPLPYRYSVRDALPWIVAQAHPDEFNGVKGQMLPTDTRPSRTIGASPSAGNGHWPASRVEAYADDETAELGASGFGSYQYSIHAEEPPAGFRDGETGQPLDLPRSVGGEWDRMPDGGHSERYSQVSRVKTGDPVGTVMAQSQWQTLHPTERRKFTIAELRRICGFPDDFELTGSYAQRWERLGRAVPPVMMSHIASTVRDQILAKADGR